MSHTTRENALSEVIGFILIIAVLTIIASLYLVYVVPAQGREAEIEHMNYIKDQFVDFKIRMDSLWLNNEPNVTVSQNIEMGTLGKKTEGNLVVIPILQPVGSDGEMVVNPNNDETISFEMQAYLAEVSKTIPPAQYAGSGIYPTQFVNISPPIFTHEDLFEPNSPYLYLGYVIPVNLSETGVTPWRVDFQVANVSDSKGLKKIYDLQMSIVKFDNNIERTVLLNSTIEHDIALDGTAEFSVDLYDPIYGLNENYAYTKFIDPEDPMNSITIKNEGGPEFKKIFVGDVTPTDMGYSEESITTKSHPTGIFSYTGNNFYWIPQTYFYQMGGVFLSQDDGETNKVVPLINLFVGSNNSAGIRISDVQINKKENSVTPKVFRISGTSPVQVLSWVTGINKNQFIKKSINLGDPDIFYLLAESPNNAKSVKIIIETNNPKLWTDTFNQILYAANVTDTGTKFPADWVSITSDANHAYLWVFGEDDPLKEYDVTFEYTKVDSEIIIQPVGFSNV